MEKHIKLFAHVNVATRSTNQTAIAVQVYGLGGGKRSAAAAENENAASGHHIMAHGEHPGDVPLLCLATVTLRRCRDRDRQRGGEAVATASGPLRGTRRRRNHRSQKRIGRHNVRRGKGLRKHARRRRQMRTVERRGGALRGGKDSAFVFIASSQTAMNAAPNRGATDALLNHAVRRGRYSRIERQASAERRNGFERLAATFEVAREAAQSGHDKPRSELNLRNPLVVISTQLLADAD